jgi:YhcH/YjgK/YiaL family protein
MIFDEITHLNTYTPLSKSFEDSFKFLISSDFALEKPQTYEIGSEGIYAILQEYAPKRKEDRFIESHHKYMDIQFMVEGKEYLGYAYKNNLKSCGYDTEHDTELLTGDITFLPFHKNYFAILFPQDAHMPGVKSSGSTQTVKKMVIKVPVEEPLKKMKIRRTKKT